MEAKPSLQLVPFQLQHIVHHEILQYNKSQFLSIEECGSFPYLLAKS